LKTRSQLRGSATCCTIQEGCNYFQKIWKPPQNSLRQADVIKQVYSILMFIGRWSDRPRVDYYKTHRPYGQEWTLHVLYMSALYNEGGM